MWNYILTVAFVQICTGTPEKLKASTTGHSLAYFGVSLDRSGDRVVIGAEKQYNGYGTGGAAYVFERSGTQWVESAMLVPSNASTHSDAFGRAVCCEHDRIAVGAPNFYSSTLLSGLAFVFSKTPSGWVEDAILHSPSGLGSPAWQFGASLDQSANTIVVGAPGLAGNPHLGASFVFVRSGTTWAHQATLLPSDSGPDDRFGYSILLDGDEAFIGSLRSDGNAPSSGAVYLYERNGATWSQKQKLTASDGASGDYFGFAMALDGDTLVVGAPTSVPVFGPGTAYVFHRTAGGWTQQQKLYFHPHGPGLMGFVGWSLALEGDWLAVGSPNYFYTSGFLHLFRKYGSRWEEQLKWTPPAGMQALQFCSSVSLYNGEVVAGAAADNELGLNAGAVYALDMNLGNPLPANYCMAKADSQGCVPEAFHIGTPSVSSALAGEPYTVIGEPTLSNVTRGSLVYSTSGSASTLFAGGTMCLQTPVKRMPAQWSVVGSTSVACTGSFSLDFNVHIASGMDPSLAAGQQVWLQWWYRDPAAPPPNSVGLTDGLTVQICP